jgi:hypothetical protein
MSSQFTQLKNQAQNAKRKSHKIADCTIEDGLIKQTEDDIHLDVS